MEDYGKVTTTGARPDIGARNDGIRSALLGESILCFGSLDWETRGRCFKRDFPQSITPTHLIHVPITRSIVMASLEKQRGGPSDDAENSFETTDRVGKRSAQPTKNNDNRPAVGDVSSLRVYSADSLEERPSGPLRLRPGLRISGLARFGVHSGTRLHFRSPIKGSAGGDGHYGRGTGKPTGGLRLGAHAAAAVGGDVIAVACCMNAVADNEVRHVDTEKRQSGEVAATVTRPPGATVVAAAAQSGSPVGVDACGEDLDAATMVTTITTIAAFEVVASTGALLPGEERNLRYNLSSKVDPPTT